MPAPRSPEYSEDRESDSGPRSMLAIGRGPFSWALYQSVRDPYLGLIAGFIFMPYLATTLYANPIEGQAATAFVGKVSGLLVAVLAPLLGATVDTIGPRKPALAIITIVMVPLIASLWFSAPGARYLSLSATLAILIAVTVLFSLNEVLLASLLALAVRPQHRAMTSGLALSLGNIVSFAMTAFILVELALPGTTNAAFLPSAPLFGLDHASHEPERATGPIVAIVFAAGALPFFLFTRDAPHTGSTRASPLHAVRSGLASIGALLREAGRHRDIMTYLIVRTVSQDASMVLMTIGGVYAAGVMHWSGVNMLAYGLLGTIAGMLAGAFAAWQDMLLGPKRALQIELFGSLLTLIGLIGTSSTTICFFWHWPQGHVPLVWNGPVFSTWPDIAYMTIAFVNFIFQIASWSSARTLLAQLAPPENVGAFFGLGAFASAATGWLGPTMVGWCTQAYQSQRAGLVPITALLLIGALGLFLVRGGGSLRFDTTQIQ